VPRLWMRTRTIIADVRRRGVLLDCCDVLRSDSVQKRPAGRTAFSHRGTKAKIGNRPTLTQPRKIKRLSRSSA